MNSRRWLAAAFILLLTALLVGCVTPDPSLERVSQSGVLRVGLDPTYPPFAMDGPNGAVGLEADIARALADELGVEARFTYFGYDGLYDALATDQVDVLISGLYAAPERTRDFTFSTPYYDAGQVLVVPSDDAEITSVNDLRDATLAVELGSAGQTAAARLSRRIPNLRLALYETPAAALESIISGDSDAALVDDTSARLFGRDRGAESLRRVLPPVVSEPLVMVTRIEDESLLRALNAALERSRESSALDRLINQWLGP